MLSLSLSSAVSLSFSSSSSSLEVWRRQRRQEANKGELNRKQHCDTNDLLVSQPLDEQAQRRSLASDYRQTHRFMHIDVTYSYTEVWSRLEAPTYGPHYYRRINRQKWTHRQSDGGSHPPSRQRAPTTAATPGHNDHQPTPPPTIIAGVATAAATSNHKRRRSCSTRESRVTAECRRQLTLPIARSTITIPIAITCAPADYIDKAAGAINSCSRINKSIRAERDRNFCSSLFQR